MAKYSRGAQKSVKEAVHRQKRGKLQSGSGAKVKSRKQAIAIGLSEAREKGAKVPPKKGGTNRGIKKSSGTKKSAAKKSSAKKSSATSSGRRTRVNRTPTKKTAAKKSATKRAAKKTSVKRGAKKTATKRSQTGTKKGAKAATRGRRRR